MQITSKILMLLTALFTFLPIWAKTAKPASKESQRKGAKANAAANEAFREVEAVMVRYREAPAVKAKVKKTVMQEAMGLENKSEGEFFFSKGKLRLDFTTPEKSTLVYDGKFVWFESRLDDKNIQVTKMRTNELKRSNSVLTALFEKKDILRGFKLVKANKTSGGQAYEFAPNNKRKDNEVQTLEIVLKNKELERISYRDQVENKVTFDFSSVSRGSVPAAKFSYKPPKNAEVTEI